MQNASAFCIPHFAFRLMVLFLFLSHLGLGIIFTLVFVSREAGVKFFRFNAGLAAILLVVAIAFFLNEVNRLRPPFGGALSTGIDAVSLSALLVSTAAITMYWATVGRTLASIRPMLVSIAVGAGLIAIVAQAFTAVSD